MPASANVSGEPVASVIARGGRGWWVVMVAVGSMFCLPFLAPFKSPPVPTFHAEILAAALGLLALCLAWALRRGAAYPLPLTLILPAAPALVLLGQWVSGFLPAPQPALLALLYLLWCAGMVMLGAMLRASMGLETVAIGLAWFSVLGGFLSTLAGAAQLLRIDALTLWVMPGGDSVWGNLGQRNHFASYLAMALAGVLLLWHKRRMPAVAALALGVPMAAMLPMSASRSVWLYATALILLALVAWMRERTSERMRLVLAAAVVLVSMLGAEWLWHLWGDNGATALHAKSIERLREVGGGERPHLWLLAWRMFEQAPWSGVGYGQYAWQYFQLNGIDARPLDGYAHNAHNIVLQLGAELGMGGILALAAGAVAGWQAVRALPPTTEAWWAICLCAVLGIHSMLEYPLWYAYFLGVAGIVLGLCGGRRLEFRPSRMLGVVLPLCLVMGWLVLAQLFRDYRYLESFLAYCYRDIDASAQVREQATRRLLEIRRTSLLAPYVELGLARAIDLSFEQLDAKLRVNGHAMRQFPVDDVVYRQAMLLALKGEIAPALRQWDWARASYPDLEAAAMSLLRRRAAELGGGLPPLLAHAESINRR